MAALPTLFSREIRSRWRLLKTSWILWVHILTSGPDTSGRPHRQFIACILKEVPNIFNRFNRWSRKSSRPWRVLSEPSAAISVIWAFPLSPVDLARAESCSVQLQNSDSDWSDLPGCPQGLKVERFSRPELKHGSTGPYPQGINSVRVIQNLGQLQTCCATHLIDG
jgi:hypothetical protein